MSGHEISRKLYSMATQCIPGGVSSPVRAFQHVGGEPVYFSHAQGAFLHDVDGNEYIDFCLSFGPHILGHSHPIVVSAIQQQVEKGVSYGACHAKEIELVQHILRAYPFLGKVRLVSSGTEAVMTAVRLARAFTGKSKVVKFEGCYHGHSDGFLARAGSGVASLSEASSKGVPPSVLQDTLIARYDSRESLETLFRRFRGQIAALILEPIPANFGLWIPEYEHIKAICSVAQAEGALILFDEVITGFRVGLAGATGYYDLKPDIVTLGKIIGGGLPLAAVVGRHEIMDQLAPLGEVYQAGTLSGNALAVTAGCAVLDFLFNQRTQVARFDKAADVFVSSLAGVLAPRFQVSSINSIFWIHQGSEMRQFPPEISEKNRREYAGLFQKALSSGIYLPPSPYEVSFLSLAHSPEILDSALGKLVECLK